MNNFLSRFTAASDVYAYKFMADCLASSIAAYNCACKSAHSDYLASPLVCEVSKLKYNIKIQLAAERGDQPNSLITSVWT